jgi:hypothetical protein
VKIGRGAIDKVVKIGRGAVHKVAAQSLRGQR